MVENIVSQIQDLDQQLRVISLQYRESNLDQAVERSECGKLDIEFIRDQERQQRIEDIRSMTRDIDAILEGTEEGN